MADSTPAEGGKTRSASSSSSSTSSSRSKYKSRPSHQRDNLDNFACGDLGFGFCLKPGGIPTRKFNPDTLEYEEDLPDNSLMRKLLNFSDDETSMKPLGKLRSSSTPCLATRNRMYSETLYEDDERRWKNFPVFDGIPLGTSLRQQRALYEEKMKEYLERKKMFTESAINEGEL